MGRALADQFGFEVGDRIPLESTIWNKMDGSRTWEFDIEGIFEDTSANPNTAFMVFSLRLL